MVKKQSVTIVKYSKMWSHYQFTRPELIRGRWSYFQDLLWNRLDLRVCIRLCHKLAKEGRYLAYFLLTEDYSLTTRWLTTELYNHKPMCHSLLLTNNSGCVFSLIIMFLLYLALLSGFITFIRGFYIIHRLCVWLTKVDLDWRYC